MKRTAPAHGKSCVSKSKGVTGMPASKQVSTAIEPHALQSTRDFRKRWSIASPRHTIRSSTTTSLRSYSAPSFWQPSRSSASTSTTKPGPWAPLRVPMVNASAASVYRGVRHSPGKSQHRSKTANVPRRTIPTLLRPLRTPAFSASVPLLQLRSRERCSTWNIPTQDFHTHPLQNPRFPPKFHHSTSSPQSSLSSPQAPPIALATRFQIGCSYRDDHHPPRQ